jgi:hypothetical protein
MTSLHTLERLRELELEHAQIEHAGAAEEANAKKCALLQAESAVAKSQTFAREQVLRSQPLSADALLRIHAFAALEQERLEAARAAWRTSQDRCDAALDKVVERFAAAAVIEKLRARRRIEADKAQARLEQKRLDESGLIHLAGS